MSYQSRQLPTESFCVRILVNYGPLTTNDVKAGNSSTNTGRHKGQKFFCMATYSDTLSVCFKWYNFLFFENNSYQHGFIGFPLSPRFQSHCQWIYCCQSMQWFNVVFLERLLAYKSAYRTILELPPLYALTPCVMQPQSFPFLGNLLVTAGLMFYTYCMSALVHLPKVLQEDFNFIFTSICFSSIFLI